MIRPSSDSPGPYRSRNGTIFGVCHGLADYFCVRVRMVQAAFVIAALFTGFWPMVMVYVVLMIYMKPEPALPFENLSDAEFYNSYTSSRPMAIERLKRTMDNLDRRIQRIEDIITTRGYAWEQRLNNGGRS